MGRFEGFPAGPVKATPLPHQFFSELLPQIESLAELKVTLHVFWLLSLKKGPVRFVTYRELEGDCVLQAGIKDEANDLRQALDSAAARGVLLHVPVELNANAEDIYLANTGQGRQLVEKLRNGEMDVGQVVLEEGWRSQPSKTDIYQLYEHNVGLLTPLIAEDLIEAEKLYPAKWIEDAFREAVRYNKRHWNYVRRILERWAIEGHADEEAGRGPFRTAEDRAPYAGWRRHSGTR